MKRAFVILIVVLFSTVVFGQRTTIKPPQLPKCTSDWLKQQYKEYSVDKAYKIEQKNQGKVNIYYYVKVMKGKDTQWYSFFKDCQNPKKITEAEAMTDPPVPLPPVKSPATEKATEGTKPAK